MLKKKNGLVLLLVMFGMLVGLLGNSPSIGTSALGSTITKTTITDGSGNPITEASQWTDIQMNFEFALPNNTVKEGDTTRIDLPEALKFLKSETIVVKNKQGQVVANAVVDENTKSITLTYTDFAETHSNVSGSFYVVVRVDTTTVTENTTIPVQIEIDKVPQFVENLDYGKVSDNPKDVFTKYGWVSRDDGTAIRYVLRVNGPGNNYDNARIEDTLKSTGLTYDPTSFKVLTGVWQINETGSLELVNSRDITSDVTVTLSDDNTGFSIDLGDIKGEGYRIDYTVMTHYDPVNGEGFDNNAKLVADEVVVANRDIKIVYQTSGGEADGYNYKIKIHKTGELSGQVRMSSGLSGATFEVYRTSTGQLIGTLVTDAGGNAELTGLLKDSYTLRETIAPVGYQLLTEDILISPEDFDENKEVFREILNFKIDDIDISGVKTWVDNNNALGLRPESIRVNLLGNSKLITSKDVSANTNWEYTFESLPVQIDGVDIVYTITEDPIDNYETQYSGWNITNELKVEETELTVSKIWRDSGDQDGLRPEAISVQLLVDGKDFGDVVTLNESNEWTFTWDRLRSHDNEKNLHVYSVKEVTEIKGYTVSYNQVDENTIEIINSRTPAMVSIAGVKSWVDNNNADGKRPEKILIHLLADGVIVETKSVTYQDDWKYQFNDMPKNEKGIQIVYSITEEPVSGYKTIVNGYDVTNTRVPTLPNTGVANSNGGTILVLGGIVMIVSSLSYNRLRRRRKQN